MSLSVRPSKGAHEVKTLAVGTVETVTSTGEAAIRLPIADAYVFVLDITLDGFDNTDKLDVFVQTRIDDGVGSNWLDVVHFAQHDAAGGLKQYVSKITLDTAVSEYEVGSALAEASVRNIAGDEWRVRWVILDSTASAQFTFSVTTIPM